MGFFPVNIQCATVDKACHFSPSWLWILWSLTVASLIGGTTIADLTHVPKNWNLGIPIEQKVIGPVITVIECLNNITAIVFILLNTVQCKTMATAMNLIAEFLKDPGEHSKRSMTENDEKALRTTAVKQISLLVILWLLQQSVVIYFLNKHWETVENVPIFLLKATVANLSSVVFLINVFQFGMVTKLLRLMIINVKSQLQVLIDMALSRTDNNWDIGRPVLFQVVKSASITNTRPSEPKKVVKVCDAIAEVRRVYGKVVRCQHQFNHSVNPQLAIVTALVLVSVVLSCYLMFQYIQSHNEEVLFLFSSGQLYMNIITAIYLIYLSDTLYKMVSFNLKVN